MYHSCVRVDSDLDHNRFPYHKLLYSIVFYLAFTLSRPTSLYSAQIRPPQISHWVSLEVGDPVLCRTQGWGRACMIKGVSIDNLKVWATRGADEGQGYRTRVLTLSNPLSLITSFAATSQTPIIAPHPWPALPISGLPARAYTSLNQSPETLNPHVTKKGAWFYRLSCSSILRWISTDAWHQYFIKCIYDAYSKIFPQFSRGIDRIIYNLVSK